MDFIEKIKDLAEKENSLKDQIQTEEATKNAFVMPFIQLLGYNVFDPSEVVPEFITDIGTKKGEKVDYAIMKDGNPIIIIECKHWKEVLDVHSTQLHRYFHVTKARFSILTNGITYRFYTDLDESNKMDDIPFLEFDISNIKEHLVNELKKFRKNSFNIDEILTTANELKYSHEIKSLMQSELNNPSEMFVKYIVKQVYSGKATEKVIEQFNPIVKKSLNQLINDKVSDRLKKALKENEESNKIEVEEKTDNEIEENSKSKIITTEEELEAFYIVKTILRKIIDPKRIIYKDTINYFNIWLDGRRATPICRLWLDYSKKYIRLYDEENKSKERIEIESIDSLYEYSESLCKTIECYINNEQEN